MISNKSRALAAVAVLSGCALVPADSMSRHSFTASIISSSIAKFRGVKDLNGGPRRTVATAIQVAAPQDKQTGNTIQAEVTPAKPEQGAAKKADAKQATGTSTTIQAEVTPAKPAQDSAKPDSAKQAATGSSTIQADVTPAKAPAAAAKTTVQNTIQVGVTPASKEALNVAPNATAGTKPSETKPLETKATDQKTAATKPATTTSGIVSNVFVDAEIKSVLNDVASLAGVTIIADDTIKEQTVSIEFKNEPVDSAVEKLALIAGGYMKQQSPGVYLISKATIDSAFFQKFAETRIYNVKNQTASSIQALLNLAYKPYLSVDPKTNTIGVCAPKQLADKIFGDIEKADRPSQQIYVEALVTEVNDQDTLNTQFNGQHGKWALGATLGITAQAAGFADLMQINALIGNHKMKLRANPHLIATAGIESTVNVGQDTYYSILSGSTIYPTSQIQLIHTGVVLKFTATVGDDGMITMQLAPSVSDAVVNVNGNPTSNIRTADTRVRVKSGESIIIAGLTQDSVDNQVTRIPLLGNIPLIGEIFTQRNKTKKKVETVFVITPRLMDGK